MKLKHPDQSRDVSNLRNYILGAVSAIPMEDLQVLHRQPKMRITPQMPTMM